METWSESDWSSSSSLSLLYISNLCDWHFEKVSTNKVQIPNLYRSSLTASQYHRQWLQAGGTYRTIAKPVHSGFVGSHAEVLWEKTGLAGRI